MLMPRSSRGTMRQSSTHNDETSSVLDRIAQEQHELENLRRTESALPAVEDIEKQLTRDQQPGRFLLLGSLLVILSILGTLTRLGLNALDSYPGQPLPSSVWAQFVGTLIFGFITELQREATEISKEYDELVARIHSPDAANGAFGLSNERNSRGNDNNIVTQEAINPRNDDRAGGRDNFAANGAALERERNGNYRSNRPSLEEELKVHPPLRPPHRALLDFKELEIALLFGYCGSTTSFSAWMLDVFRSLANVDPHIPRPHGRSFQAVVGTLLATFAVSIAGYSLGHSIANLEEMPFPSVTVPRPKRFGRCAIAALAVGFWAGAAIFTGIKEQYRGVVGFAMVFTPFGMDLRSWTTLSSPILYCI